MADIQDFVQDGEPQLFPVPMPSSTPDWIQILVSINSLLYTIVNEFSNKKKKSGVKKEEVQQERKRKLYRKKNDGTVEFIKSSITDLDANRNTYYTRLAEEFPNICMMEDPLTYEEYNKLVDRFTRPAVRDMMDQFNNFKKIGLYISAYKAIYNWLMRDERKEAQRR